MPIFTLPTILTDLGDAGLPDPVMYQYYVCLSKRKILINDLIGDDLVEYALLPYQEMDSDGTGEPIEILINTDGGDAYVGFSFVDAIDKAKTPTTIHIMANALSMGLFIAMAGRDNPNVKTVCHPFSQGLLHDISYSLEGKNCSIKDNFEFIQRFKSKIMDFIVSHSNITEEFYKQIEDKEFWMDAEDMVKYGIVDEIV